MNLTELARRRQILLAKIEAQRIELAGLARNWEAPLRVADTAVRAARYVRAHPGILVVGALALVALRRKGAWRLASGAWQLLRKNPAVLSLGSRLLFGFLRRRGK